MADFEWSKLAFGSKKPLNELQAIFVAAPREISAERFRQLVAANLPKSNMIIGIAKEDFVRGFEGQPQFRTLKLRDIQPIIDRVNRNASVKHKIYTMEYAGADLVHILEKCRFKKVILINGSWLYAFHVTKPYYVLSEKAIPHELVSPFTDEAEAMDYDKRLRSRIHNAIPLPKPGELLTDAQMMQSAETAGKRSYDYNFQTGLVLGKRASGKKPGYHFLAAMHNKIVPYETYAMHHGAARERNFSPPHDLNHYDTVHAEVGLIIEAARNHIELKGTSLFITLLPCPTCSRMFAASPIEEFVYSADHSSGYAVHMLEAAGKKVRRLVIE